jgi:hypothetical protein
MSRQLPLKLQSCCLDIGEGTEFLPRHPEFEKMTLVAEGCLSFQPENRLGFGEISEKLGTLFVCIFFIHLLNPLQKKERKYPLLKHRAAAQEKQLQELKGELNRQEQEFQEKLKGELERQGQQFQEKLKSELARKAI